MNKIPFRQLYLRIKSLLGSYEIKLNLLSYKKGFNYIAFMSKDFETNVEGDQIALELMHQPVIKDKIQTDWKMTAGGISYMGTLSRQILALVFAQMGTRDDGIYQISINELIDFGAEKNTLYKSKNIKDALSEMLSCHFIAEKSEEEMQGFHLLDTTKKGATCGYKKGVFTFRVNPLVENFFTEYKQFANYDTQALFQARSFYTWQFVWALSRFTDTGQWLISVKDYEVFMRCDTVLNSKGKPKKDKEGNNIPRYNSTVKLLKKTSETAMEELKGTNLEFKPGKHVTKQMGRGRPTITHFVFDLVNKPKANVIPQKWWDDDDRRTCMNYMKTWGVSERGIVEHAQFFGKELHSIVSWMAKEIDLSNKGERDVPIEKVNGWVYKTFEALRQKKIDNPDKPVVEPIKPSGDSLSVAMKERDRQSREQARIASEMPFEL